MMSNLSTYIKRWADDEYWNGHLISTLIGYWGPDVETNIALGSMSQDDLGHAKMIYGSYMKPEEINRHIFFSEPDNFVAHPLVLAWEESNWAFIVVKQFLYKEAELLRIHYIKHHLNPQDTKWSFLNQMVEEERLHIKHWREWLSVLSQSLEGIQRMEEAWKTLYPYALDLVLSYTELIPDSMPTTQYEQQLRKVLHHIGLDQQFTFEMTEKKSLSTVHQEIFRQVCMDMQAVYRLDPAANWG